MQDSLSALAKELRKYETPSQRESVSQVGLTLVLFVVSLGLGVFLGKGSLLWAAPFVFVAGLLQVRVFVLQHDCGHFSFFAQKWKCRWLGRALSLITLIPFDFWRRTHDLHHATTGNLDRRGFGDIDTLTLAEFEAARPFKKLFYRIYRSRVGLLVLGPVFYLGFRLRVPFVQPVQDGRAIASIVLTNISILLIHGLAAHFVGLRIWLVCFGATSMISGTVGILLFYVQHQFSNAYWKRSGEWDYYAAAVFGSSLLDLPTVLHWFSGNIGFHTTHHLNSHIPNYRLREATQSSSLLSSTNVLAPAAVFEALRLKLWNEDKSRLEEF